MSTKARVLRGLGAVLLGGALLPVAPGVSAATTSPEGATALPAPTLETATTTGDRSTLTWERVADPRVTGYVVRADGKLLQAGWRYGASADFALVDLGSVGLTGREVFTVSAASGFGQDGIPLVESRPSNGLKLVAPGTLPAPVLTSATLQRDRSVTLTWTASRSADEVISYRVFVDVSPSPIASVDNTTSITFLPDLCGGACPLNGTETYSIRAVDRTMAESPVSRGLVPQPV